MIPGEVPKPPYDNTDQERPEAPIITVKPPAPSLFMMKELEQKFQNQSKLYDDETMRSKAYRKKIEELQKELAQVKSKQGQGGVQRPFDSEAENDYVRLVRKCMVAINDYELEIIELKKHIHQLEKHKDMHDDHLKLEVVKKPHHNIPAECEHLNKTELELEHEVKRLTRKIQAIEHDAQETSDRLNKQLHLKDSKLNELRQNIKERQLQAIEPFQKEVDKLRREIDNHKLTQQQNEEIIKELTEGHLKESKRLPGNSKTFENINKIIGKAFSDAEKEIPKVGVAISSTKVKGIIANTRVAIEVALNKLQS